ncbi:hypothetical protein [Streptomyces sp. NPDC001165]|uniref:hypothetical protein n=1 Tax=Streptomyces sp. NPDC001165 TaxID=3364546 RepID=UPI0036C39CB7
MIAGVEVEGTAPIRPHEHFVSHRVGKMPEIGTVFGRWLDPTIAVAPDPAADTGAVMWSRR